MSNRDVQYRKIYSQPMPEFVMRKSKFCKPELCSEIYTLELWFKILLFFAEKNMCIFPHKVTDVT